MATPARSIGCLALVMARISRVRTAMKMAMATPEPGHGDEMSKDHGVAMVADATGMTAVRQQERPGAERGPETGDHQVPALDLTDPGDGVTWPWAQPVRPPARPGRTPPDGVSPAAGRTGRRRARPDGGRSAGARRGARGRRQLGDDAGQGDPEAEVVVGQLPGQATGDVRPQMSSEGERKATVSAGHERVGKEHEGAPPQQHVAPVAALAPPVADGDRVVGEEDPQPGRRWRGRRRG